MKFIDDSSKKNLKWKNRNYFYLGLFLYIIVNITVYVCIFSTSAEVESAFIQSFINSFLHSSWSHILLNLLTISIGLIYVERKYGTIKTILLILLMSLLGGNLATIMLGDIWWHGASVVWFSLHGFILVDYIFSFRKSKRNLTNIIVGAVVLIALYIRAGFFDKPGGGIGWTTSPYQLINNKIHIAGFIVGLVLALLCFTFQILFMILEKENKIQKQKNSKFDKIFPISFISLLLSVVLACFVLCPICINRKTLTINLLNSNEQVVYSQKIEIQKEIMTLSELLQNWENDNNISDSYEIYLDKDFSELFDKSQMNSTTYPFIINNEIWYLDLTSMDYFHFNLPTTLNLYVSLT